MKLKDLEDYPALEQLAESLWGTGDTRGASVMVGAGFSRNAIRPSPDSKQPPLWWNFAQVMSRKLGYEDSPPDALKLAEEYKAVYGEPSLEGLIRELVPDDQWVPGELHQQLLDLPWSDVLTTNWDTLLEKSSEVSLNRRYEVVRQVSDIARTRSPRIVKLHGSLPNSPFIFTEEDYRTYPVKYSPFVNFVRQVILENDLCLIGFSGEDPNFIEWSGWVRDELGASARRIFLIGLLNLTPAKRLYLQARHITPIDLSGLIHKDIEDEHAFVTSVLLEYFHNKDKALETWPDECLYRDLSGLNDRNRGSDGDRCKAGKDPEFAALRIKRKLEQISKMRESYPQWLVCPDHFSSKIRRCLEDSLFGFFKAVEYLSEEEVSSVLYEMAWGHEVADLYLRPPIIKLLSEFVEGTLDTKVSLAKRAFVASVLLRVARVCGDDEAFSFLSSWMESNPFSDFNATLGYEKALKCLYRLDFVGVSESLPSIVGNDPVWNFRRAFIYAELGETEEAIRLIRSTTIDLQGRRLKDPNSVWILSRLAWGAYLAQGTKYQTLNSKDEYTSNLVFEAKHWPLSLEKVRADSSDFLKSMDDKIDKALSKKEKAKNPIRPRYDLGHYNDASKIITSGSKQDFEAYKAIRIAEAVGIPVHLGAENLWRSRFEKLMLLEKSFSLSVDEYLQNVRLLAHTNTDFIDKTLSRLDVAAMDKDVVESLVLELGRVITYAKSRQGKGLDTIYWLGRLNNYHEIQSRFVGRLSEGGAGQIFLDSKQYFCEINNLNHMMFESLGNLMRRSLEAIDPAVRIKFALDILSFPLPCEKQFYIREPGWPCFNGLISWDLVARDSQNSLWETRVKELIDIVREDESSSRFGAVCRLLEVYQSNLLTTSEQAKFAEALWSQREGENFFPKNTLLYLHAFMNLPAPEGVQVESLFRQHMYETLPKKGERPSEDTMLSLIGATYGDGYSCFPSLEQARLMLHFLISIEPLSESDQHWSMVRGDQRMIQHIGRAIAQTVMPIFDSKTWLKKDTKAVIEWINNDKVGFSLEVLPQLMRLDSTTYTFAEEKIRRGMASREKSSRAAAHSAVRYWLKLDGSSELPFPERLVRIIVGMVSNRRRPLLHDTIWLICTLLKAKKVSQDDIGLLEEALEDLEFETSYGNPDTNPDEVHTFPFIRANCVCLSKTLIEAGQDSAQAKKWLEIADLDPLPEVRQASYVSGD